MRNARWYCSETRDQRLRALGESITSPDVVASERDRRLVGPRFAQTDVVEVSASPTPNRRATRPRSTDCADGELTDDEFERRLD